MKTSHERPAGLKTRLHKIMKSNVFQGIIALVLWIISAGLSLYATFEFQMLVFRLYILCCEDNRWGFLITRQWSSIFLIGIWLAFTIITGEFHYQHVRERRSWRLFGWSYLVIVIVLAISLAVG